MKFLARIFLAAYDYTVFYLGLLEFCLISLAWSTVAGVLHIVLPRDLGRRVGRYGIMLSFRIFLASLEASGRFKFDLGQLDALRGETALIIAPNHPSLWDAVMMTSRLPDAACIMKAVIVNNILFGGGARLARYIPNDSIRGMISMSIQELQRGNHVLLFPEGTRTVTPPVGTIKGSIGVIACRARAQVQTILVETDTPFLSKGWPAYRKPRMPMRYSVRLGRRFEPGADSAALVTELQEYFNTALAACPQPHPAAAHEPLRLEAPQKDYAK